MVLRGVGTLVIAACLTGAWTPPAGAAAHGRRHIHRRGHRASTPRRNAREADLSGYEFELTVEGEHVLTGDEEAGNRAAVEAAENSASGVRRAEEETPSEAER